MTTRGRAIDQQFALQRADGSFVSGGQMAPWGCQARDGLDSPLTGDEVGAASQGGSDDAPEESEQLELATEDR
jgi:hypothetical protein